MKRYFAYIRVSTIKQGEHGSSLQEQRDAIVAFAARHGISITEWFEERETAAKLGRREFNRMLGLLKRGKAAGVVFHKIDRGARNLKDWSVIQDLTERGIDVRFVHETIDMKSNEGKLTGDFLAVIASHFIRNLRDEVKKGMRGRLKQGLYPFKAPIGYLDQGGGKPKIPDPVRAPFVRMAFELYASGQHSLGSLCEELNRRGFRTGSGKPLSVTQLHKLLHNPFYAGLIVVQRSSEAYPGVHEPLVSMHLFQAVQRALSGNANARVVAHDFLFRRLVRCRSCSRSLTGERQKGHVYYRCHSAVCPRASLREEAIDDAIRLRLSPFTFTDEEIAEMRGMLLKMNDQDATSAVERGQARKLRLENVQGRLSRLLDAYLDGAIEKPAFETKKQDLLVEQRLVEEAIANEAKHRNGGQASEMFELLTTLSLSYEMGKFEEKRNLLRITTSNLWAEGKDVAVALHSPYQEAAELLDLSEGEHFRKEVRTRRERLKRLVEIIVDYGSGHAEDSHDGKKSRGDSDRAAA